MKNFSHKDIDLAVQNVKNFNSHIENLEQIGKHGEASKTSILLEYVNTLYILIGSDLVNENIEMLIKKMIDSDYLNEKGKEDDKKLLQTHYDSYLSIEASKYNSGGNIGVESRPSSSLVWKAVPNEKGKKHLLAIKSLFDTQTDVSAFLSNEIIGAKDGKLSINGVLFPQKVTSLNGARIILKKLDEGTFNLIELMEGVLGLGISFRDDFESVDMLDSKTSLDVFNTEENINLFNKLGTILDPNKEGLKLIVDVVNTAEELESTNWKCKIYYINLSTGLIEVFEGSYTAYIENVFSV